MNSDEFLEICEEAAQAVTERDDLRSRLSFQELLNAELIKSEAQKERERDEARAESIRWQSIAEGRSRTDDESEPLPCNWQANEDGQWTTDCGEMFEFTWLDGPTENQFKFCPFCGGVLTPKPYTPDDP